MKTARVWLKIYCFLQWVLWWRIYSNLIILVISYFTDFNGFTEKPLQYINSPELKATDLKNLLTNFYEATQHPLAISQTFALIELFNTLLLHGMNPENVDIPYKQLFTCLVQISARFLNGTIVPRYCPKFTSGLGFSLMIFVWGTMEIVRYLKEIVSVDL